MSTYESILEINPWMSLTTASTTTTNLLIRTIGGVQYQVAWGDGTITTHNSDTVANKTYASPYAGEIKIRAVSGGLRNIDKLQITAGNWNFNISVLKYYVPNLTFLYLQSNTSTWGGSLADVPSGVTTLYLNSSASTWSGSLADMPSGVTNLTLSSNLSTWSGNLADIPSVVTTLTLISNLSTWSGNLADVPSGVTTLALSSNLSTWGGNLADIPSGVTTLYLASILSTWTYTAGRVWLNMIQVFLRPKAGSFTSTMTDNLFIDLDASPLVTGAGTIDLRGNCGAPTSASLSARNSLVSKGKTVLHN